MEKEEPLKVGDKLTIKKIDKRLKNPDLNWTNSKKQK